MDEHDSLKLRQVGDAHTKQGRYPEALESYRQSLELYPNDADTLRRMADVLLALGKDQDALHCYDRIIALQPDESWALIEKGDILAWLGQNEEAIRCFDLGLNLDRRNSDCWRKKASALAALLQRSEALQCYDTALEFDPDNADTWSAKGDVLADLQQFPQALACYENAAACPGSSFQAEDWSNRGDKLSGAQAIYCYDKSIASDQNYFWAWRGKGLNLMAEERFDEAMSCLDRCLEIMPKEPTALIDKGVLLVRQADPLRAKPLFEKALELDPKNFYAWYNQGVVCQTLGQYKEAIQSFDKAIEINRNDSDVWMGKAWCSEQLNNFQQAITSYDQAIELAPNSPWPFNGKGCNLSKLKNYQEALKLFDQAIAIDEKEYLPWANKSDTLQKLDRLDEAIDCLESALNKVARDRDQILTGLGYIFGDYKYDDQKALDLYRQALAISPNDLGTQASIGECLVKLGHYAEGRACALEVERCATDSALQCVARYLVMVSYALEGDVKGSQNHFQRFIDHFTAQSEGQAYVGNWSYNGLVDAVTKSKVAQETKFILLALIDLQLGKIPRSNLTFFAAPPDDEASNADVTSASFAHA